MGLADSIRDQLAQVAIDAPDASAVVLEGKDVPVGIDEIVFLIGQRQRVLEAAVIRLAEEIEKSD